MPINLTQSCFQQIKNTFSLTNREHQPSNSASTNSGNNDGFRIEHEKQRQTHLVKDNPQLRKLFSGKPINPNDEPAVFFKKGADNEGSSTILVRKLENLTESRIVSAELKKENVISGKMSELQAHALWQADKAYWPLISNNNKDNGFSSVSFYYPSESFQSEIDGIVSKKNSRARFNL